MPSRRRLLRRCATAIPLGVAGCLGTGDDPPGGTGTPGRTTTNTTPTTEATPTTETTAEPTSTTVGPPPEVREVEPASVSDRGVPTGPPVESDAEKPYLAFAVGTRDGVANPENNLPHALWVWNDTDEARTVELSLATGGTTLIDDDYEIPARKPLGIELREPRAYEWTVRTDGREKTGTVPRIQFDCNHSATDVLVRDDELKEMTITTEMWCQTTTASGEA